LAGLADVRNKFEGFFQEQQQKLEESFSSHFDIGHKSHNHHGGGVVGGVIGGVGGGGIGSAHSSPAHQQLRTKNPNHHSSKEGDYGYLQTTVSQHDSTTNSSSSPMGQRSQNRSRTSTSDVPVPTLSSVVYKRRSGYGKYSTKNAWERRRMDLVGTTLRYFAEVTITMDQDKGGATKVGEATTAGEVNSSGGGGGGGGSILMSTPSGEEALDSGITLPTSKPPKKDIRFLWEQAKENITKTTENLATSLSQNNYQNLDPNAPRGTIDLIKENAIVAAMSVPRTGGVDYHLNSNHLSSTTPTPFGICIIVKNEVKWKICFDTQREQMQWLAILTEMIVQHNVDMYNEGLTLSRSRRGATSSSGRGGRCTPTITSNSAISASNSSDDRETADNNETMRDVESTNTTDEMFHGPPGGNDHDLWQLDQKYSLTNLFILAKSGNAADTAAATSTDNCRVKEDANTNNVDCVDVKKQRISVSKSPLRFLYQIISDGASSGPSLSLTGNNVLILSFIFNLIIKIVHSLGNGWRFWFSVLLANLFFWILTINDNIKGEGQERISFLVSFLESLLWNGLNNGSSHERASGNKQTATETTDDATVKPSVPLIKGFKPIAGSTTKRVKDESDSTSIYGENFIAWTVLPPDDVQVRSHGYLKTKQKVPSPPALYEIIGCDVLISARRLENLSTLVKLPSMEFDDSEGERTWNSPDIFAISLAVPTEEPSMTRPSTDGEGFSVTAYYKMKKETRDILRKITTSGEKILNEETHDSDIQRCVINAVKLWENWCTNAPHNEKIQARFKFIPNVHNPKDVGLPSYIAKYCGKPVLIKRANVTGFLSSNPNINAMEFGISLHPFPYLAKKAMAYLKSTAFPKAIVSLSYVIEGRSDSELPEVLIGDALKLLYPNPDLACNCDDFLAGTAKSSVVTRIEDKCDSKPESLKLPR